jgi:hypothetical protein
MSKLSFIELYPFHRAVARAHVSRGWSGAAIWNTDIDAVGMTPICSDIDDRLNRQGSFVRQFQLHGSRISLLQVTMMEDLCWMYVFNFPESHC